MPNALFRIRLEDGRTVRAGLDTALRRVVVRLISGAKVIVRVSPVDPHRGQIIEKL